ncbi:MAG TPA: winged helix-turn-helix domain-containing protein [Solirubrobacterales bacterium]|nr:winged helix-turn-helix domain-containing protein [Solirubrobacterales bacterium]
MAVKSKTKSAKKGKKTSGVDQKLVKALAHPLRVEILMILNERMASPNELSKELEEGLSQVSYHVKVLKDFDCIEMVKTEPRRGAVEHYYRATSRAFLADRDWKHLPDSIKPGVSASVFESMVDDVVGSMQTGMFNKRDDVHMSWTPGVVDEQGWDESTDLINETLEKIMKIHSGSAKRLARSGEEGVPATVVLMNFEGAPTGAKSGRATKKQSKAKKASKKA